MMTTNALERDGERSHAAQLKQEALPASFSLSRRLFAWSAHLLTASGAVVGLFSLVAITQREWRLAWLWLCLAFVIDAVDGTLARAAHVGEVLPDFSGKMLDYVIDFVTFVVAPALFLYQADMLPEPARLVCVAAILLVSGYHYGNLKAVTADYHFKGLPGPWNVIVFYLFVLELGRWWNVLIVAAACILHFVPIKFIYPTRTRRLRSLTVGLTFLGCFLNAVILLWYPVRNPLLIIASLLILGYMLALSLYQTFAD
jgi:phosphatidylcholine synthase